MRLLIYGINFSPELTDIGKYSGEMVERLVAQRYEVWRCGKWVMLDSLIFCGYRPRVLGLLSKLNDEG